MSSGAFADLGVSRPVLGALAERGISEPFAVQRLCIADVLAGEDVLVQSPTGSGKTLAFGIPMIERIAAESRRPAALVLAPRASSPSRSSTSFARSPIPGP
jgi:superfamily II DNA/RNA helicase